MIRILALLGVISREVIQLALVTLVLMILFEDVSCLPTMNTPIEQADYEDYVEVEETARENRGLSSMAEKCREKCISKYAPVSSKYSSSAQIDPLNSVPNSMPQHSRIKRVGRAKKISSYSYSQCLYEISDCLQCWKSCQSLEPPQTQDYLLTSVDMSKEIPVNSVISTHETTSSHWKPPNEQSQPYTSTTTPSPVQSPSSIHVMPQSRATGPSLFSTKSPSAPVPHSVTQPPPNKYSPIVDRGNELGIAPTETELPSSEVFKRHSKTQAETVSAAKSKSSARPYHSRTQDNGELAKRKHMDQMMLLGRLLQRVPQNQHKQQRRRYNNYEFYRRQKSLNTTELEFEDVAFIEGDDVIILEGLDR